MKVPQLTRAMTVERAVRVADGAGGFSETWQSMGTLWGEVVTGAGARASNEEVITAGIPVRITLRGAPPGGPSRPVAGQRLRDGTRLYRIEAVTERDAGGRFLTCFARQEEPV